MNNSKAKNFLESFAHFQDKAAVKELFTVIGPKIATRPGGYTRIIRLGIRPGDNAEKAMIELVDFNEVYGKHIVATVAEVEAEVATEPVKKTRRAGAKKKADATDEVTTTTDEVTTTEETTPTAE